MQRGGISDAGSDAGSGAAGGEPPRPRTSREVARRIALGEGRRWWSEPRSAVLIVLGGVVLLGGGWRLLHAWKGRRLIARLEDGDLTAAEVEAVAPCGRAALPALFRLLGEAPSAELRAAAGRAIAALWARDELIAEEEQALVRRAYRVDWHARRRYPRALAREIPIAVDYDVQHLTEDGGGISPANLEWSHRLIGARRAALETYSEWRPGPGRCRFLVIPGDFDGNGPHRLALQARVRTRDLTSRWQIELPAVPFSFEFDPRLEVDSLFTLPDSQRELELSRSIGLEATPRPEDEPPRFLALSGDLMLRDPPGLVVRTPIPCDLAHRMSLEIEGLDGRRQAGNVVLGGQGERAGEATSVSGRTFPIDPIAPVPEGWVDRPGRRRLRAILEPDAELGWTDPDIRSIWPGTLATGWCDVEVVRR